MTPADSANQSDPSQGQLVVTLAEPADIAAIVGISESTDAWLAARGIDAGVPPRPMPEIIAETVAWHAMYVAKIDVAAVGSLSLYWNHEALWDDLPANACYVHGLQVHRAWAGRGIGRAMLAWAEQQALAAHKAALRLDCMGNNPALRKYYEDAGFTHRGDVALPHRLAARYERRLPQGASE